jgi:hypothetical protein
MRHLISSVNNVQEKMSRRFDELYRADLLELGVKNIQILLVSMAKELYRKQCLVLQIFNSSTVDR